MTVAFFSRGAVRSARLFCCPLLLSLVACASEPPRAAEPPSAHRGKKKASAPAKPLNPDQLKRVMNGKSTAMAGCYEVSESKNHASTGSLTIEFEVGTDGKVSGERVADSSLSDDVLHECVLGVVHKTRFPKATAPTDVSWPVRFRAAD